LTKTPILSGFFFDRSRHLSEINALKEVKKMTDRSLNRIARDIAPSKYIAEPHPTVNIDGVSLDRYIYQLTQEQAVLGLIPTWLGWMIDQREQRYVWQQSQLSANPTILPILICPDDLDFSCTTLSAEVVLQSNDIVVWQKIGYDFSDFQLQNNPVSVDVNIEWITAIPPLYFNKASYQKVYRSFRQTAESEEAFVAAIRC
jgi:hypothetical protein